LVVAGTPGKFHCQQYLQDLERHRPSWTQAVSRNDTNRRVRATADLQVVAQVSPPV
jgi:hypothetical protein